MDIIKQKRRRLVISFCAAGLCLLIFGVSVGAFYTAFGWFAKNDSVNATNMSIMMTKPETGPFFEEGGTSDIEKIILPGHEIAFIMNADDAANLESITLSQITNVFETVPSTTDGLSLFEYFLYNGDIKFFPLSHESIVNQDFIDYYDDNLRAAIAPVLKCKIVPLIAGTNTYSSITWSDENTTLVSVPSATSTATFEVATTQTPTLRKPEQTETPYTMTFTTDGGYSMPTQVIDDNGRANGIALVIYFEPDCILNLTVDGNDIEYLSSNGFLFQSVSIKYTTVLNQTP